MEKVLEGKPDPRVRVILIGPDCSGKTSIAERLRHHYGIWGKGNRKAGSDIEMLHAVLDFAVNIIPENEFILDQWQYPVDIVYEMAINERISPVMLLHPLLKPYLEEHKVLFIHVTADVDTIAKRYSARGDELWNLEQILAARRQYLEYLPMSGLTYKVVDTSRWNEDECAWLAIQEIEQFYGGADDER